MFRSIAIGTVILASAICSYGQTCTIEISAGLNTRDGQLIRDASAAEFRSDTKNVQLEKLVFDQGPRRVVFIIQRGAKMNEAARTLTAAILTNLLKAARSQDTFGLITVGPGNTRIALGSQPGEILTQATALLNQKAAGKSSGVLDGVTQALQWFGEPQVGDAIYVFAGDNRLDDSKAQFDKVISELWQRKTRVFGFLFGYVNQTEYVTWFTGSFAEMYRAPIWHPGDIPWWSAMPYQDNLNYLSWGSGGGLIVENTQGVWQTYKIDPRRTAVLAQMGYQIYGSIIDVYRLTLTRRASAKLFEWRLGISDDLHTQHPDAIVLYPHRVPACS